MSLTIVMYHYVREIKNSNYPGIKGLEFEAFKRQLDYLQDSYNIIAPEELISCIKAGKEFPKNSCLLSFDDGYKDHIKYVLPEFAKRKLKGAFFPVAKVATDREMLDVNRIHYILASVSDTDLLLSDLDDLLHTHNISDLKRKELWDAYAVANRFDPKEVIFIKRVLQHGLPENIRNEIAKSLFLKYVSKDEISFSDELYMSSEDLKMMVDAGMYIGSHGYKHLWLDKISTEIQEDEISRSLTFLESIGASTHDWVMCYPYGAYNQDTLNILKKKNCIAGLTTEVGKAMADKNPLELPRFDTNDFPQ